MINSDQEYMNTNPSNIDAEDEVKNYSATNYSGNSSKLTYDEHEQDEHETEISDNKTENTNTTECCSEDERQSSHNYVAKLKSLVVLVCFSQRNHTWTSTAPNWTKKKKHVKKKVNYRKHVDVSNKTIIHELSKFKFVTSWELPPFKVDHVR